MKARSIQKITYAQEFQMGPMRVKQPLPVTELKQVSPFILLHHAGPDHHEPDGRRSRLSPHPHRGFEPVTFLFQGKLHHKDSLGNEGFLDAGDVQWMTSGRGIIHSEGPSEAFVKEGGELELVQLWVNLPRANKMTEPGYQDIKSSSIPVLYQDDQKIRLRLVAGEYEGVKGPARTFTPIIAMMIDFEKEAQFEMAIPSLWNALVYVLEGSVQLDNKELDTRHLAAFHHDGEGIRFSTITQGKLLLLAGEPIEEPVVSHGPFVMNYPAEIKEAILDYETGKMGALDS